MIDVEKLFNLVLPWAKGCPEPGVHEELVNAAREFCSATRIVQRPVTINSVENQQSYSLFANNTTTVQGIDQEEEPIDALSFQCQDNQNNTWALQQGYPTYWRTDVQPGPPWQYAFVPVNEVAFWQIPDAGPYILTGVIATKPRRGATVIADEIVREYDQAIAAGALARILATPNRDWSQPAIVPKYAAEFQAGISQARQQLIRAFTAGSYRARPRPFIT